MPQAEIALAQPADRPWSVVEDHLPLVARLARGFHGLRVPVEELEAEGRLGLFEAAKRFDPAHEVKFSTYATWWILKKIREAIAAQASLVRLPRSRVDAIRRARGIERELRISFGRPPSSAEVAAAARIPIEQVDAMRLEGRREVSLDEPIGDVEGLRFGEVLRQTLVPQPDEALLLEDGHARIGRALQRLPERQREVLELRYGLDGGTPHSLAAIAAIYGISRERVHQIEGEAVALVRRLLRIG